MAREVMELLARIRPEGVDETVDGLEEAQESFEETAETASDEAGNLERFSERFRGALAVATTGLAVAATGLLSQVPVIGETMSALGAVIDSTALKIDQTLRPALSGLNRDLFELSTAINETEGARGDLIGSFSTIGTLATVAGGSIAALVSPFVGLAAAATLLGFGVGLVVSELAGLTDVTGVQETELNGLLGVIQDIATILTGPLLFSFAVVSGFLRGGWKGAIEGAKESLLTIGDAAFDLFVRLGSFIAQLIPRIRFGFRKAFQLALNEVKKAANGILDAIESAISQTVNSLNQFAGTDFQSPSFSRFETRTTQDILSSNQRRERGRISAIQTAEQQILEGNALDRLISNLNDQNETVLRIDGREVARAISNDLGEDFANRGR